MFQIYTVWQWNGIEEPANSQETLWEWSGQLRPIHQPGNLQLLCNPSPHHNWNIANLQKRPRSFPTPTTGSHAAISQWPWIWMIKHTALHLPRIGKHLMRTDSRMHKRQWIGLLLVFKFKTESTSKTNNLENRIWNGKPDTGLSVSSDEGYYLYIKNQPTGKTQSCNVKEVVHKLPVSFGKLTPKLAEQANKSSYKSTYHHLQH